MKLVYLKSALKCNSFDATIGIKIPCFRVSVTIEPGCSLLQIVTPNCLMSDRSDGAGKSKKPGRENNHQKIEQLG